MTFMHEMRRTFLFTSFNGGLARHTSFNGGLALSHTVSALHRAFLCVFQLHSAYFVNIVAQLNTSFSVNLIKVIKKVCIPIQRQYK